MEYGKDGLSGLNAQNLVTLDSVSDHEPVQIHLLKTTANIAQALDLKRNFV